MARINILLLAIHYPFAIKTYWENAIRRNPHLDLVTTGPYTSSFIPWLGGMNLPEKYSKVPTYPIPFKPNIGKVPYELVRTNLPEKWIPDIILSIDAGINWIRKPQEGIVVTVGTDSHVLDYSHARSISDKFFNMHPAFSEKGDILLSYAYDPGTHYATSIEKDTDAVLIGMPYPIRVEWIDRLRSKGVSVLFENGPILDEYRELNNRARIGLNWSSKKDLNARVLEIMAMNLCPVIDRVQDLDTLGFVEDQHYLGFDEIDEAIEKVLWAKRNPEESNSIALSAYNKVHHDNLTYDRLVNTVLKECRLQ